MAELAGPAAASALDDLVSAELDELPGIESPRAELDDGGASVELPGIECGGADDSESEESEPNSGGPGGGGRIDRRGHRRRTGGGGGGAGSGSGSARPGGAPWTGGPPTWPTPAGSATRTSRLNSRYIREHSV